MSEEPRIYTAFLNELNKESWKRSPNPWSFVANLNGVDIYHKTFDKHLGLLGEAFLPEVEPDQLFSFFQPRDSYFTFY